MTKTIRVENADNATFKVVVEVWDKGTPGTETSTQMDEKKQRILALEQEVIKWKAACVRNDELAKARFEADRIRIEALEHERLRFYRADGTFEELADSGAVVERRIRCAEIIEDFGSLLSSAYAIAERKGRGTAWERYAKQLALAGISPITAKTFRVLPGDSEPDNSTQGGHDAGK